MSPLSRLCSKDSGACCEVISLLFMVSWAQHACWGPKCLHLDHQRQWFGVFMAKTVGHLEHVATDIGGFRQFAQMLIHKSGINGDRVAAAVRGSK
jgi:hypothetical protein